MQANRKIIILMDSDTQVLKGMMLLLEDMQLRVVPASHWGELEDIARKLTDCPVLMLLPFETDIQYSGIELVQKLRGIFKYRIPAILLSHENGHNPEQHIDEDILVLSDRSTPQQLRNTILRMLDNEPVV